MSNQVLALLLTLALFAFLGGWALFIDFLQRKRRKRVIAQHCAVASNSEAIARNEQASTI
jgi:hypothetical protein